MTTDEAIRVGKIMLKNREGAAARVSELLITCEDIDWTEFFNGMDDYMDDAMHDAIFYLLEQHREGRL